MNKKIVFALALISAQNIMPAATPQPQEGPQQKGMTNAQLLNSPQALLVESLSARIEEARASEGYQGFLDGFNGNKEMRAMKNLGKLLVTHRKREVDAINRCDNLLEASLSAIKSNLPNGGRGAINFILSRC